MELNWSVIEDDIAHNKDEIIDKLVNFSLNDVMLFWSTDADLRAEQEKKWLPVLRWVVRDMGVKVKTTDGLDTPQDNMNGREKLKSYLENLNTKKLASFYMAAVHMRSVLLAMALAEGKIDAQKAFEFSELEELYQARKWGSEPVAQARRENLKKDLISIENHLRQ